MYASNLWLSTAASAWTRRPAARALLIALVVALSALMPSAEANASGVSVAALSPAEVERVLSSIPLKDLSGEQLSEVLAGRLSNSPSGGLKEALAKAIDGLAAKGGTLGQLAGSSELTSELEKQLNGLPLTEKLSLEGLLGVLGGHSLASVLSEKLGSLEERGVVGALLKAASEPGQSLDPEQLIEKLLTAPSSEKLETLLGSALSGEPFVKTTVGGLASQAGTTAGALAEDFNATSAQLPATAMALTTPLTNGKTLGVLDALEGIDVGTLTHEVLGSPGGPGGAGGGSSGGTGGPGGNGGAGGASSGAPGSTTIVNEFASPGATPASAKIASAKVRILSRKARGEAITLVVQAPAAGRLTVAGKGVRSVSRQTDKAERVTVRVILTRADAALVHRHHRRLGIKLKVSFAPVSGASSTASTTITVG